MEFSIEKAKKILESYLNHMGLKIQEYIEIGDPIQYFDHVSRNIKAAIEGDPTPHTYTVVDSWHVDRILED